jgi:hypothetical protein
MYHFYTNWNHYNSLKKKYQKMFIFLYPTDSKTIFQETQCSTDQFSITGPGGSVPPVICGTNTGQHGWETFFKLFLFWNATGKYVF